jgi:hypothetical protein
VSLQGNGLLIDLPAGWSGRVFIPGLADPDGESANRPAMHLASFPVPVDDASYGSGVVSSLTATQSFIALVEYTPDVFTPDNVASPDEILADPSSYFDPTVAAFGNGLPTLVASDFSSDYMHGDSDLLAPTAWQTFFSLAGRPFGLFVVVGDQANLSGAVATGNTILQTLVVSPVMHATLQLQIAVDVAMSCTGSGTGVGLLARADGGNSERVPATFNFSGSVTYRGICIDRYEVTGTLSTTLADGRSLSVPGRLLLGGTVAPLTTGVLFVEDDPAGLPVAVALTWRGGCDQVSSLSVTGGFVATLNSVSAAVSVPATSVTATPAGQVALPVAFTGNAGGSGVLSLFQIGAAKSAATASPGRRTLLGRKRFTVRGDRTVVRVRLSRRARRLLARTRRLRAEVAVQVEDPDGRVVRSTGTVVIRPPRTR